MLKLLAASSDESICQVKDLIGSIGHCYPDLHSLYFHPDSRYISKHPAAHSLNKCFLPPILSSER